MLPVFTYFAGIYVYNACGMCKNMNVKARNRKKLKIKFNKSSAELNSALPWLKRIGWGIIAFFMSFSSLVGGCCPFAVSLITASSKMNVAFAAVGAGVGYIFFCDDEQAIRYFSAVIISSISTFIMTILNNKKDAVLPMVISALSVMSTGFVMNLRLGAGAGEYALMLGESVLAAGGSYFFYKAVSCDMRRLKLKALSVSDLTCVLISSAVVLSGLSFVQIKGVSPARVVAVFAILSTIRYGSQRWSMIVALCLGFALGISRENSLFLLGAYAFSALLSSLFTSFSSLGVGVSYCLSMTFFAIAANMGSFSVCCVVESIIASAVLVLLPDIVADRLNELWEGGADIAPEGSLRQSLVVRLRLASCAIAQVSESVRDVRERINSLGNVNPVDSELRMVASDQFFSISDMLEDLAFEFDEAESFDCRSAGKIRRMLGEYNIYPENISVIVDKFGRYRIEILAPKGTKGLDNPKVRGELCKICKRELDTPKISFSSAGVVMICTEKPNFKMSIGFSQYCAEGKLCGDTIKTINDSRGHTILIISDGMGKGSRAALDGAMGAGLLSKLLCAGFGFDASLKVVNSALLVKSSEESLATLDCASIDLFTGKCEFYKAGAPKSYILKNDRLTKCELSSMPAGILRGIEFAKRTTVLCAGDELVMLSDGVTDSGDEWLDEFIECYDGANAQEKAQAILEQAVEHGDKNHLDDMSVIVARLM